MLCALIATFFFAKVKYSAICRLYVALANSAEFVHMRRVKSELLVTTEPFCFRSCEVARRSGTTG
jgi:hypothetical protein